MIRQIAEKISFPTDAISYLEAQNEILLANPLAKELLGRAMDLVFASAELTYEAYLDVIAQETQIPRYTVNMLFFLQGADRMKKLYLEKGLDEEIYWNSLSDLKYKLIECKNLHGYYGTFAKNWFPRFLRVEGVALGRLQYECKPFKLDSYEDLLQKDELVCYCHIPSSGPLLEEDVIASLKRAYKFYEPYHKNGVLPILCDSWLLYPPLAELFGKDSNTDRFYRMFKIIRQLPKPNNSDFWRIFSIPFSPENLQNAPENSSLQRKVKQFLLDGNCMGVGLGLLLFDGERILTAH